MVPGEEQLRCKEIIDWSYLVVCKQNGNCISGNLNVSAGLGVGHKTGNENLLQSSARNSMVF